MVGGRICCKDANAVTRELKLALIVGFALVLVVTVLISDHLSHARQAELAGNIPSGPIKVVEPPTIAMGSEAPIAPAQTPETRSAALTAGTHAPDSPLPGLAGTTPSSSPNLDSMPPTVISQGRTPANGATGTDDAGLTDTVRKMGGDIRDGKIFIGEPAAKVVKEPITGTVTPVPAHTTPSTGTPTVLPVSTTPDRLYTVIAGDSAFKIAKQNYGEGKVWRKLLKYNKMDEEAPLKVGMQVKIPSSEVLLGKKTSPVTLPNGGTVAVAGLHKDDVTLYSPGSHSPASLTVTPVATKAHTYTVKKGDTLEEIARHELGSSKRAPEIANLNKKVIKDPDNVPLGAVLTLPA